MNPQEFIDKIKDFATNEPQTFWIIVLIIIVILYLMFKPKKHTQSNIGMDRFNWQVFQRKNK